MATKRTTTTTSKTRDILVILDGNRRRKVSNIPANAKITFGPVSPGNGRYNEQNALRIYTSQQNQLAVFVGVKEFRDLSLDVKEEKVSRRSKSESSSRGVTSEDSIEYEWDEAF